MLSCQVMISLCCRDSVLYSHRREPLRILASTKVFVIIDLGVQILSESAPLTCDPPVNPTVTRAHGIKNGPG